VTNNGSNNVSAFAIGAGGGLSAVSGSPFGAGTSPEGVAVSPDGGHLYVTNNGSNNVSAFAIGAGGGLSAVSGSPFGAGTNPGRVAVTPDQGPVAAFSATPAPAGSASGFDGSASSDPDGTVVRYDWDFGDGTSAPNAGPTPSHTYTAAGTHAVTLRVTDDAGCSTNRVFTGQTVGCNGQSSAQTTQPITIGQAVTATGLGSSANPSTVGESVTFTATVTGAGPTGTVDFKDGATTIGACGAQAVGGGTATCTTSSLSVGGHAVTAVYGGDANNQGSTSPALSQVVDAAPAAPAASPTPAPPPPLAPLPPGEFSPPNAFAFATVAIERDGLRFTFDFPGPGTLDALATTHRLTAKTARLRPGPHRLSVGRLHASADGPGPRTFRLPLNANGRRILAIRGKLPIRLSLVYTPTGGQNSRQARKYTIHPA
jgi:hypothetical protein